MKCNGPRTAARERQADVAGRAEPVRSVDRARAREAACPDAFEILGAENVRSSRIIPAVSAADNEHEGFAASGGSGFHQLHYASQINRTRQREAAGVSVPHAEKTDQFRRPLSLLVGQIGGALHATNEAGGRVA